MPTNARTPTPDGTPSQEALEFSHTGRGSRGWRGRRASPGPPGCAWWTQDQRRRLVVVHYQRVSSATSGPTRGPNRGGARRGLHSGTVRLLESQTTVNLKGGWVGGVVHPHASTTATGTGPASPQDPNVTHERKSHKQVTHAPPPPSTLAPPTSAGGENTRLWELGGSAMDRDRWCPLPRARTVSDSSSRTLRWASCST